LLTPFVVNYDGTDAGYFAWYVYSTNNKDKARDVLFCLPLRKFVPEVATIHTNNTCMPVPSGKLLPK